MANPQFLLLGNDLFALGYVIEYPTITEVKSFSQNKLTTNSYDIQVRNEDNFFSVNNSISVFSNITWLYTPLVIIDSNGEEIWNGILTAIERNHTDKTAILKTKNSLFKVRNQIIEYKSLTWETGAEIFQNVCDNIGFTDYDNVSVLASIGTLQNASCYMKADIKKEDNLTFQQFVEKIAEYSGADVYVHKNKINFSVWKEFTGGVSVYLSDSDFKTLPSITENETDMINDYSIGYYQDAGTPATDSNSNNIGYTARLRYDTKSLPEMKSTDGEQLIYKDKVSAIFIGELYIKKNIKNYSINPQPLSIINFSLASDNKNWIDLNTYISVSLTDESWTEKIFEIISYSVNEDNDDISITAIEVII